MAVERASYTTIVKDGNFELRLYDPMVVIISQDNDLKGTTGFNQLFSYIGGYNKKSKKIAMTAPVINYLDSERSSIAFVMPKDLSLEELPQPLNSELELKEIPARYVASISFSGDVTQVIINKKKLELEKWLKEKRLTAIGSIELARYNPPFIPRIFKNNELLVEVK